MAGFFCPFTSHPRHLSLPQNKIMADILFNRQGVTLLAYWNCYHANTSGAPERNFKKPHSQKIFTKIILSAEQSKCPPGQVPTTFQPRPMPSSTLLAYSMPIEVYAQFQYRSGDMCLTKPSRFPKP